MKDLIKEICLADGSTIICSDNCKIIDNVVGKKSVVIKQNSNDQDQDEEAIINSCESSDSEIKDVGSEENEDNIDVEGNINSEHIGFKYANSYKNNNNIKLNICMMFIRKKLIYKEFIKGWASAFSGSIIGNNRIITDLYYISLFNNINNVKIAIGQSYYYLSIGGSRISSNILCSSPKISYVSTLYEIDMAAIKQICINNITITCDG
jgi:hypothetical protein